MTKISCLICVMLFALSGISQIYTDRAGYASFFSSTPLEDIKAENKQVFAAVDISKKELAFALLLKGFTFKKQLMQTHFNENYVESDLYPKATFSGSFTSKEGNEITVKGNLMLHGVTRQIEIPATLQIGNDLLIGYSKFKLKPEDFNIEIPGLVKNNIAKEIEVEIKINAAVKK